MKVETAKVCDLAPYAGNAKKHGSADVAAIAASIEQFGFNDPIGVWHDENGTPVIVEGHGRLLAAKLLELEEVPIIALDHLDDEARRAYVHVHNQTTLNTGFDIDALNAELASLPDFEWPEFGFTFDGVGDWFAERERNDTAHEDGNDEYNAFIDKFEPKKTTDDCYTPDVVYNAVAEWVANEYGLDRAQFVRPFFPGGDYEREQYPQGCTVVDNPPFSIITEIVRFYVERGIKFFLFAPTLTLFSGRNLYICHVCADCDIVYENGATVNTGFLTNLDEDNIVRTAPTLNEAVRRAVMEYREEIAKPVNLKYRYPPHVITSAMVSGWSNYGVEFRVPKRSAKQINELDAQRESGKTIFGSGYLISETAKDEAERAKREAARVKSEYDHAKALEAARALEAAKTLEAAVEIDPDTGEVIWRLSERERQIIDGLQ